MERCKRKAKCNFFRMLPSAYNLTWPGKLDSIPFLPQRSGKKEGFNTNMQVNVKTTFCLTSVIYIVSGYTAGHSVPCQYQRDFSVSFTWTQKLYSQIDKKNLWWFFLLISCYFMKNLPTGLHYLCRIFHKHNLSKIWSCSKLLSYRLEQPFICPLRPLLWDMGSKHCLLILYFKKRYCRFWVYEGFFRVHEKGCLIGF